MLFRSIGQLVLVATHAQGAMTAGLVVFGIGVQGAKIAVDTIVQSDTADAYRGRTFGRCATDLDLWTGVPRLTIGGGK